MTDLAKQGDVYSFGQFKADVSRGELVKAGLQLRLQEKPFRVLAILLESPNEIVSREELRNRLWPADTFVEFDDSLNAAVKKLRVALGDSADEPRFVETVPRRGYRFIAPVRKATAAHSEEAGPFHGQAPVEASQRRILPRWGIAFAAAAALSAMIATSFVRHSRNATPTQINSIAVLPLENLSADEEQAFFADGMTDELITDLAKTGALRVISRNSVMHYKGLHKSIPEIGRELNVDAVVEGTVSRSDDRIMLRAQLIKAEPEQHVWAESYDRPRGDLVVLQGQLARDIAAAIRIKLQSKQQDQFARHIADPEAHELYLKGRYFWNKRETEGYRKAIEYFDEARSHDPNFALAYAGLANAYAFMAAELGPEVSRQRSKEFAERALALDSESAEAHATLGLLASSGWDWEGAREHLERAIEINPNYATAHQWYAELYLAATGHIDEGISEMKKARQLDPLSPNITSDLGKLYFFAGRYNDATTQFHKALELDPHFSVAHFLLSITYLEEGMKADAFRELELMKPAFSHSVYLGELAYFHARTGDTDKARQELTHLLRLPKDDFVDPGLVGNIYFALGEKDNGFAWLNKAAKSFSTYLGCLDVCKGWDPVRSDPRFMELKRQIRLPGA